MKKLKLTLVFLPLLCITLIAQDTVAFSRHLKMFHFIQVRRRDESNYVRTDIPDSLTQRLYLSGTFSELMGQGGMLFTKSQGAGALSTMALRGGNSMQTPVIWNGINLQSITNNTVDLSLLPVFLFDAIALQLGSTSASWGSGAIGGTIQVLSPRYQYAPDGSVLFNDFIKAKVMASYGSFGDFMQGAQLSAGNKKHSMDIRAYHRTAENNYTFTNTAQLNAPLDTLEHASFRQQGLDVRSYFKTGNNSYLKAEIWIQETFRKLPPGMLELSSSETQQDYSLRSMLEWNKSSFNQKWLIRIKTAYIHEGISYFSGFGAPYNTAQQTSYSEAEVRYTGFKKWVLSGGVNSIYAAAEVTQAIPFKEQYRSGLFLSSRYWFNDSMEVAVNGRLELINGKPVEPVGAVGYSWKALNWLHVKMNVSHNYRIPTFNDLYWQPGGNPDLRAEKSWAQELTLGFSRRKMFYDITAYNRDVYDMIVWQPGAQYWSPVNIASVSSRGLEHRFHADFNIRKLKLQPEVAVDYVRAVNRQTDRPDIYNKQIIYVPAYRAAATLNLLYEGFFISAQYQYTDIRFTAPDHTSWLPEYALVNLAAGKHHLFKKEHMMLAVDAFFRINNMLNESYQSVLWRPMPGRSYSAGVMLEFVKRKKLSIDS
ncbi:MAG: TonB-dependent receptor [Bacteroidia bacterium]